MVKYIIIGFILSYVLRRFILAPIPGSNRHQQQQFDKSRDPIQYTDYEEVDRKK